MLIKSQLLTSVSGSIGGVVGSHNKGGMYLRGLSQPTNPNTGRQQAMKSIMGTLVQAWESALTPAQRAAWNERGQNVPVNGRLGDPIQLSGQNWFIRSNSARLQYGASTLTGGAAMVLNAPAQQNTGEPPNTVTAVTFTPATDSFELEVDFVTEASAVGTMLLYTGNPLNAGRRYYRGPYQLAAAVGFLDMATSATITADVTDPTEWAAQAVPGVGDHLPIRVVNVFGDGRVSQDLRVIVDVADGSE